MPILPMIMMGRTNADGHGRNKGYNYNDSSGSDSSSSDLSLLEWSSSNSDSDSSETDSISSISSLSSYFTSNESTEFINDQPIVDNEGVYSQNVSTNNEEIANLGRHFETEYTSDQEQLNEHLDVNPTNKDKKGNESKDGDIKIRKSTKRHQCSWEYCGNVKNSYLQRHLKSHSGEKPFVCETCQASYTRNDTLQSHREKVHSIKPGSIFYTCQTCGATFNQIRALNAHGIVHTGQKMYNCSWPNCKLSFKTKSALWTHHCRTHIIRVHRCSQCEKTFKRKIYLNKHYLVHANIRPYKCNFKNCGLSFRTNYNLKNHLKTHTGEKPYACTQEGCGKWFPRKDNLKEHMRTHRDASVD